MRLEQKISDQNEQEYYKYIVVYLSFGALSAVTFINK